MMFGLNKWIEVGMKHSYVKVVKAAVYFNETI